jgi:predicted secreted hydrolase
MNRARRLLTALAVLATCASCSRPATPLPEVAAPAPAPPSPIVLPRDAGTHDALTEWWYFTGHLWSESDSREFGFEFTIFQARRQGMSAGYLAHFAISDIAGGRFSHQARVSQAEAGMAFPLEINGWSLSTDNGADVIDAAMLPRPGADPPYAMHLRLTDEKPIPIALHHGGYLDLGSPGGSNYYSRTRLSVTGSLQRGDGAPLVVSGTGWMDHQWGNFVVAGSVGWDWYSLQLDDRTELMLYVLRPATSTGAPGGVYGTYVRADGSVRDLAPDSVRVTATGTWSSPHTGAVYPSGWNITLADDVSLEVTPRLVDQELYFPDAAMQVPAYWEGAVTVTGNRSGVGYVELTGYAQ